MKKRIPIDDLRPGMYLVGIGKPGLETLYFVLKRRIRREKEISLLKQYGISEVVIDPTRGDVGKEFRPRPLRPTPNILGVMDSITSELPIAQTVRTEALATVQRVFQGVKERGRIDCAPLKKAVGGILDSLLRCRDASLMVLQMRRFDDDLFNHAVNVCVISLLVAKDQGLDEQKLAQLGMGALLHDVGWMCLPQNLLHVHGDTTEEERRLMEKHPDAGIATLSRSGDISDDVLRVILEHHERLDGTGYPGRLQGGQISSLSRIVAVTNLFDSMVRGSWGHPVLPLTAGLRHLYHLGTSGQLDLIWVEQTIRSLGVYPVGSLVELDTGERAIVMSVNPENTLRPVMKVIQDQGKQPYPDPQVVDISVTASGEPERFIRRALDPAKEAIDVSQYIDVGSPGICAGASGL